jgi:paraquat-inducible protein A
MSRPLSAAEAGLIRCPTCDFLARYQSLHAHHCPRCGERIFVRKPDSITRTTAYLVAAAVLYLPANLLPIMHTATLVGGEDDTIMSGVIVLVKTGSWPLALLVFFASIMVPLLKLIALTVLVLAVHRRWQSPPLGRLRLYRLVEFIGRWSLLDIYVLTLLVALVHLQGVATVEPRPGAIAFGAVVVLTLLSARSFDPRLLWDDPRDPWRSCHERS